MRRKLAFVVLAALTLGLAYLMMQTMERYEETVDHGWSQAALRNPFLATETFLRNQGLVAYSTDRGNVLKRLSRNGTLLISDIGLMHNDKLADDLEAWLEQGGHAIVEAPWYEDDDAFQARFGVYKFPLDERDSEGKNEKLSDTFAQMREDILRGMEQDAIHRQTIREGWGVDEVLRRLEARTDPSRLTRLNFSDESHALLIDFGDNGILYHPDIYYEERYHQPALYYSVGNGYGTTFMQLEVGDGLITVVTSMDIWTSEHIGLFDHAHLLKGLVEASEEIVFLTGVRSLSLMEMIWENFSELLLITLLWLLAWIVYRARRFGPVLHSEAEGRRSFVEHIQAAGHFMWRQKQSQDLLTALRTDLWQMMQGRFPVSEATPDTERLAPLLQYTHFEYSELHNLMFGVAPEDELQFINMVKSLQEIRKGL